MACIIKRKYKAKLPSGKIVTRTCDHYTVQYRDAAGRLQRVKGYRDKKATEQLAARLQFARERGEEDMIDPYKGQKGRQLSEHLAEWAAHLIAAGRVHKYARECEHRIKVVAEVAGWETLTDVEANGFLRWRESAKATPRNGTEKDEKTVAARTLNHYLASLNAFLNWCVRPGKRIGANPLRDVDKVQGPKRRQRRAASDPQAAKLVEIAPEAHKLVYRMAIATGLRRNELAQLVWGDLRLNAIRPFIQLRAHTTKARRADCVPLPDSLAQDLRRHRPAAASDADRLFAHVPTMDEYRADLKAAGIPYKDAMGRRLDFHALRTTMNTRLNRNGVPLATTMRLMRVTDARLVMVDYLDEQSIGVEETVLPEPVKTAPPLPAQATGTA